MKDEKTLVVIKPEGMKVHIVRAIFGYLLSDNVEIDDIKMVIVTKEFAMKHYAVHRDKPFFDKLTSHLSGKFHDTNRLIAMVLKGEDIVRQVRKRIGNFDPDLAPHYTIRGRFGKKTKYGDDIIYENVVHASSSIEEAETEIKLWFEETY